MSMDKAIQSGKEHRKQYIGKKKCKLIDPNCRNHGSCPWCKGNRIYKFKKAKQKADYQEEK